MKTILLRAADQLFPAGTNKFGTVPALLVVLTFVTGVVDSVSYLGFRHVFVANMTGNVAFFGFALAGAKGLSLWASALAIGAFVVGAFSAGRLHRWLSDPAKHFPAIIALHTVFVGAALAVALAAGIRTDGAQATLIALLGYGMGLQNAVVRRLAVPDMTTTVLTLTLTGLASDAPGRATVRRLISVGAILGGALSGGALFLHSGTGAALTLAFVLLALVAVAARVTATELKAPEPKAP